LLPTISPPILMALGPILLYGRRGLQAQGSGPVGNARLQRRLGTTALFVTHDQMKQ
jgi:hypothetical protein